MNIYSNKNFPQPRSMCCYIIRSQEGSVYVGITADFKRRLKQHNRGACISTKKLGTNWERVQVYEGLNYMQASKLERFLHKFKQQVMSVVSLHPEWDDWLQTRTACFPTTEYERRKMYMDCGLCGMPIWRCGCDYGI